MKRIEIDAELRKLLLENVKDECITRGWADWFYNEFIKRTKEKK